MTNNKRNNIDIQLHSIINEWLNSAKIKVKVSTYTKYYYIINKYIITYFNDILMYDLTSKMVADFTNKLMENKKLSNKTIRDILCVLGSIIRYYKLNYDNNINVNIVYPRVDKHEITVLSDSKIKVLEQYVINNRSVKTLGILLTLYTGLRIGEICCLKWDDINLCDGYISVTKTLQRVKNFDTTDDRKTKLIEDSPKSVSSVRQIPLPDFLTPLLEQYKNAHEIYFLTEKCKCIDPRIYHNFFKRCMKQCNIENITFHTLRHTFATRCINSGFDVKSLSEILGHANVSITLDRYVHPSFSVKKSNMNKVAPLAI